MKRYANLVGAVLLLAGFCELVKAEERTVAGEASYSWRRGDSSLALVNGDKVVWQVNFDKKEGKPYFHPVGLVDGTELTWLRPADHRWHRALWFSWKFINGLNYWEEDPNTGMSAGQTEVVEVQIRRHKDYSAEIEMTLSYHRPGEPGLLTEKRLIRISAPGEDGRYHIDWYSKFTAGEKDVVLGRTPILGEEGGQGWGGYAGLSVRMAKATLGWQFVDSEGRKDKEGHGKKARWVDFSGEIGGDKAAGIAIFDYPDNLRHPSPWYVEKGMPYFSPAVLFNKPYTIGAGESLTLRYRILIHCGRGDKGMLEAEWERYVRWLHDPSESAKRLKRLLRPLLMYANDYDNNLPETLDKLKEYEMSPGDLQWFVENIEYLGRGKSAATSRPDTIIAYDKTLLAEGKGTNVLFFDGHVTFAEPSLLRKHGIEEKKAAILVDLLVCEANGDVKMDRETVSEVKKLVDEKKGLSAAAVLRDVVQNEQVKKGKFESVVDLLSSRGYLKIMMNPTLEVVEGHTGKVRTSQRGPDGKDIIDSFEVKPRILDDGCIGLKTDVIIEGMALRQSNEETGMERRLRMSSVENRIRDGGSIIIGGMTKVEKRGVVRGVPVLKDIPLIGQLFLRRDFEERTREILVIVTASISTDN